MILFIIIIITIGCSPGATQMEGNFFFQSNHHQHIHTCSKYNNVRKSVNFKDLQT